ncbi:trypsin-like peptidase domain-containing protein [Acinetobacter sp. A3.8]|uniref:Trypsin-like peptidase domain-containing protein n=1 Tax=Acinetobacter sedimenti TaxID=2919922 RepID=A0A9X1WWY8_9GAMM|nr:trypsin-like peptidase domain-containing protein [Acinetobacter sedimenti]MCJ8146689.1 trypsin-like peptidase domain-containing protein [Acinetobacter sedimenti]
MRRLFVVLPWLLLVIVIVGFIAWQKMQVPKPPVAADGVKMPAENVEPLIDTSRTGGVVSYSGAVEVAAPAVVNIFTLQKVTQQQSLPINEQFLREFFGDQIPEQLQPEDQNSLGSGVIVRPDGYILTNNHVIAQADEIVVGLHDGRKAKATVIGTDPETDLAVIKIELEDLPVLPFKLSGNAVGDVVLAIGNPFGVGQTVTQGIISATGRTGLGINTYEDFIQTDAAINPGNSGGALIDVAGNLIGVNTAIFSRTGGSLGIGFAIPAQICQQVLDSILQEGRVVRGWLGIEVRGLSQNNPLNTESNAGVQVMGVLKNGPADQAGIQKGDIILSINDQAFENSNQLISYVGRQKPNSEVPAVILRADKKLNITIKIAERPESKTGQFLPVPQQQPR